MTQLDTYLAQTGIRQSEIADNIGISRGYMSDLVAGEKTPSLKIALAIERVTAGAVPASCWVAAPELKAS